MKKFATVASLVLVVIEGAVSMIPFLASWWVCAIYRAILTGWAVSCMDSTEKRAALRLLLGSDK
jgi:hypothetical protein